MKVKFTFSDKQSRAYEVLEHSIRKYNNTYDVVN